MDAGKECRSKLDRCVVEFEIGCANHVSIFSLARLPLVKLGSFALNPSYREIVVKISSSPEKTSSLHVFGNNHSLFVNSQIFFKSNCPRILLILVPFLDIALLTVFSAKINCRDFAKAPTEKCGRRPCRGDRG